MVMPQVAITDRFNQLMPPALEMAIVQGLRRAYQGAADDVLQYHRDAARDFIGHRRRAQFETELFEIGERFAEARPFSRPNEVGSYHHVTLEVGSLWLTASKVDTEDEVPRNAGFRQQYARSAQLSFLDDDLPPSDDEVLYGIVRHGSDSSMMHLPAFVNIGFPSRDGRLILAKVDLYARHPELIPDVPEVVAVERTDRPISLRLRQGISGS